MRRQLLTTVILLLSIWNYSYTQTTTKKSTNNKKVVVQQLKEIFGDSYNEYIKGDNEKIDFYLEFYNRCEFIPINELEGVNVNTIKNLSSLIIKDKYNPSVIKHDNLSEFQEEGFNVLKYFFNFYNTSDDYYKVYNTNVILKINKKSE